MLPLLLIVGVIVAWLVLAALLALAIGRAVAVARVREQHRPPRGPAGWRSSTRSTRTAVLTLATSTRSR